MTRHPGPSAPMSTGKKITLATAVIVVAVAVVVITLLVRGKHTGSRSTAPSASSPSGSPSASQPDGPNGCVGGSDPTTAISTAFNEPLTERGAIQFSGTAFRWMFDSNTTSEQLHNVGARLLSSDLLDSATKVNQAVPSGVNQGFSTKNSYAWVKSFDATKGSATVLLTGQIRTSDQTHVSERDAGLVLELTTKDGHWFIKRNDRGSYSTGAEGYAGVSRDARAHGGPLAGGCGE